MSIVPMYIRINKNPKPSTKTNIYCFSEFIFKKKEKTKQNKRVKRMFRKTAGFGARPLPSRPAIQIVQDMKGINRACLSTVQGIVIREKKELERKRQLQIEKEERAQRKVEAARLREIREQERLERKAEREAKALERKKVAARKTFDAEVKRLRAQLATVELPDYVYAIYDDGTMIKTDGTIWREDAQIAAFDTIEAAVSYQESLPLPPGELVDVYGKVYLYKLDLEAMKAAAEQEREASDDHEAEEVGEEEPQVSDDESDHEDVDVRGELHAQEESEEGEHSQDEGEQSEGGEEEGEQEESEEEGE